MFARALTLAVCLAWLSACSTTQSPAPVAPAGYYRVQSGDTLYRIALKHRQSVANLARWNSLKDSASINAGQLLRVAPPDGAKTAQAKPAAPKPAAKQPTKPAASAPAAQPPSLLALTWPSGGPVLARFDGSRNKGIDIGGAAGSPVRAAAGGKVVYAGKGIRAYGNLLIIKHDDNTLTVYAHNQKLLVKEDQMVKSGETIATMGDTGANRVKLHFELRYKNQAIDPLPHLPSQRP
ncbi:peptidase [Xenophilus sp. AP218F]|nr:peptidase [Xenophilus sp. AP218F]